ncbi:MAG: hypothetical protein M3Y79_11450 [Pseudomonadota bacterium]|nr:hypothetical protein [Pseudomonadota bacterium]
MNVRLATFVITTIVIAGIGSVWWRSHEAEKEAAGVARVTDQQVVAPEIARDPESPVPTAAISEPAAGNRARIDVPLEDILAKNPGLPAEFKDKIRENVAAIRRGEPVVEEGSVPGLDKRIEALRPRLRQLDEVINAGLTRKPSDVSGTSLEGAFVGAHVTGTRTDNGWTGIGRVFQDPVLGAVILSETDLNAGNSASRLIPREAVNVNVRGAPGALSVLSDPTSGLSMSRLVWVDESGVSYEMLIQRTDVSAQNSMRQIAESIRP